MFKVGDKIVCIRYNKFYIEVLDNIFYLEVGKTYEISNIIGHEIYLVGKQNLICSENDFISLKEYRKQKITKIECLNKVKR